MGAIIGNLGFFMQVAAYAMPHKIPNHSKTAGTHEALHRRADVRQQGARPYQFNGAEQGFLRHGQQPQFSGSTMPTGTVMALSPCQPSTMAPTSRLTMSPFWMRRGPPLPCTTSSLMEMQSWPGNPRYR